MLFSRFVVLFFGFAVWHCCAMSSAFVDPINGVDSQSSDCESSAPCRTIERALQETDGDGDILNLFPGIHTVSAQLNIADEITVQGLGANPQETVIVPSPGLSTRIFSVDTGCTFRNFEIRGAPTINDGAVLRIDSDDLGVVMVQNVRFTQASANAQDQIISVCNLGPADSVIFDGCVWENNPGGPSNILLFVQSSAVTVQNSRFSNNTGESLIQVVGNQVLNLQNTEFRNNIVEQPLLFETSSTVSFLSDCLFANNIGAETGGILSERPLTVSNNTFTNNAAFGDGGAISISADTGNFIIMNSFFARNTVLNLADGGAIYKEGAGSLEISATTFEDHVLQSLLNGLFVGNGGTIFHREGSLVMTGVTIRNSSAGLGGAMYLVGTTSLTGCTINENIVGNGAIAFEGANVMIASSSVSSLNLFGNAQVQLTDAATGQALIGAQVADSILGFQEGGSISTLTLRQSLPLPSQVQITGDLAISTRFDWTGGTVTSDTLTILSSCTGAWRGNLILTSTTSLAGQVVFQVGTLTLNDPLTVEMGGEFVVDNGQGPVQINGGTNAITNQGMLRLFGVTLNTDVTLTAMGTLSVRLVDALRTDGFTSTRNFALAGTLNFDRVFPYWPTPTSSITVGMTSLSLTGAFDAFARLQGARSGVGNTYTFQATAAPLVVGNDIVGTVEDVPIFFNPLLNDVGSGGDLELVSISPMVGSTSMSTVELDQDPTAIAGSLQYTPGPDFSGSEFFTYQVRNPSNNDQMSGSVQFVVVDINDAPIAPAFSTLLVNESSTTFTLSAQDIDTPAEALLFELLQLPQVGTLSDASGTPIANTSLGMLLPGPVLTFDLPEMAADSPLLATVAYRVFDGELFSSSAVLTLDFNPNRNTQPQSPTGLIVGLTVSLGLCLICVLFVAAGCGVYAWRKKSVRVVQFGAVEFEGVASTFSGGTSPHTGGQYEQLVASSRLHRATIIESTDFKLQEKIGEGGFVAVKQVKSDAIDEKGLSDFLEEAKVTASLPKHENVVQMIGICPRPLAILIEFLAGGSLRNYLLANLSIPMPKKLSWMIHIAKGMDHIHQSGIVHRDLAARNVLLTEDYKTAKISDFGMSRLAAADSNYTQSGVGPLKWMAPECLISKSYSKKSDVWAYGVTCVEILTHQKPFPDLDLQRFAVEFLSNGVRVTSYIPEDCPQLVSSMIHQTQRESPEARPAFSEIVTVLSGKANSQSLEVVSLSSENQSQQDMFAPTSPRQWENENAQLRAQHQLPHQPLHQLPHQPPRQLPQQPRTAPRALPSQPQNGPGPVPARTGIFANPPRPVPPQRSAPFNKSQNQ